MLNIASHIASARNASQARVMLSTCVKMLAGGYHTGITLSCAEALAKDAGGATVQTLIATDGLENHCLRHVMKGAEVKQLKADITALRKDVVSTLPVKVSAKAYQLDTFALTPGLMDMTVGQVVALTEKYGVKTVIHNGVITMGTGKLAVRMDSTDGQLMDKDTAHWRAIQGKLTALGYILSQGGKLTKSQVATLDDARAQNALVPNTFKVPNALGQ